MTTTNIFGFEFICDADYESLSAAMLEFVNEPANGISNVITPNAHGINVYHKHKALNNFCKSSKFVLPDGQPLVWLSKVRGTKIKKRLTGSDLFPVLYNRLKELKLPLLFVASDTLVAEKLKADNSLNTVLVPPMLSMDNEHAIADFASVLAATIIASELKFVFIGISEPKQGAVAMATTAQLKKMGYSNACLFLFLGASYQFYFGLIKRAPAFFRNNGLEWFYRLVSEPKRMYKRYIFGNLNFIFKAVIWVLFPNYFARK